jgi:hypothetical protein
MSDVRRQQIDPTVLGFQRQSEWAAVTVQQDFDHGPKLAALHHEIVPAHQLIFIPIYLSSRSKLELPINVELFVQISPPIN